MQKFLGSKNAPFLAIVLFAMAYIFRSSFPSIEYHEQIASLMGLLALSILTLYAHFSGRIPTINLILILLLTILFLALPLLFDI